MKNLIGLMLMATMLLSASAVFADHAPPNQTADVYISENVSPALATHAIQFSELTVTDILVFAEVNYPVTSPLKTEIAVSSGQGFWRCEEDLYLKNSKQVVQGNEIRITRGLHKPGHNHIARPS